MKSAEEKTARRAGITRRHLDYVVKAERNASPGLAKKLERITGVPRETWVFGNKRNRLSAWRKFAKAYNMRGKV